MTDRHASSSVALVVFTVLVAAVLAAGRIPAPAAAQQPATAAPDPFAAWPKGVKPDAVLVISGQTYGYLQPCGCSRPQLGGLERRANFVKSIRDRGWPVAGFDLGDVPPAAGVLPAQVALKYATAMNALREMGYVAVGVGRAECNNGLFLLLNQYAAKKEQPPYTLAGNVAGNPSGVAGGKLTPREDAFFGPGKRPMVGLVEVTEVGAVPVGVAGVVGPTVQKAVTAVDPAKTLVGFTAEKAALADATKQLAAHAKKPQLNVLLYQGTAAEAKAAAKDWPQFRIVVSQASPTEPQQTSEVLDVGGGQRTLLVRVGYKGRHVAAVGVFQKADGTFDMRYEFVPMSEAWSTPGSEDEARKANPVLGLLDNYAETVKTRNLIKDFPQYPPPGQESFPKLDLSFGGSESCAKCHPGETAKWKESRHSHAYEALEKQAKRPALRQYDGECAICHTTGLGYKTGFRNETDTANLKHVGCESCHGPGAGHAADAKNATLVSLQSSWRKAKDEKLPDAATMERLAKFTPAERERSLKPAQWKAAVAVGGVCMSCHDQDNDPNFDLFTYWPKVVHPPAKK